MARIEPDPPIDRDERLGEAIETYLAEAEVGEAPDPETFASRYPDLSTDLLEALDGLALVRGLVGEGSGPGRSLEAGRRVAGYRIVRELGRGGMGVVYEAVHVDLDRPVALKVLGAHAAPDSTGRRRFLNEAKTAAGLHHTHIVPVFDVGQVGGLCYYAMQRIEGCGLDRVLKVLRKDRSVAAGSGTHRSGRRGTAVEDDESEPGLSISSLGAETVSWQSGRPSRPRGRLHPHADPDTAPPFDPPKGSAYYRWVAAVGRQAAEALAHAHKRGVIHRDVKPSNLLVDARGTVWVADFGLARRLADPAMTQTDSLLGTPRYMSPEQARTGPVDGRSDVYSLGATLYELLTLRPPFDGRSAAELVQQITNREPSSPRKTDPRLPRDLETIVLKAMAKRPADRYASAQDLADDLSRFLAFEPVQARRIGPVGRTWRFARRHPTVSSVSTAALLVVLSVASWAHLRVVAELDNTRLARDALKAAILEKDQALRDLEAANAESEAARRRQYLSEASLIRFSTVSDRRKAGLGMLAEAARLGPGPGLEIKLRDEAVEFLSVRDIEAREPIRTGRTWGLAFSGDNELAAFSEDGTQLRLYQVNTDGQTPPPPRVVPVSNEGDFPGFDPPIPPLRFPPWDGRLGSGLAASGRLLTVVRPDGFGLQRIVPSTGSVVDEIDLDGRHIDAVFASPDGRRLLTQHRVSETRGPSHLPDGLRALLWDPEHRDQPIATLAEPPEPDETSRHRFQFPLAAFSPDGRVIALAWHISGSDDSSWNIRLVDAEDGSQLGSIDSLPAPVTALAMGPDGLLAAAVTDGTVRLWDSLTNTALPGLYHHQFYVRALRFSPDGSLLAIAGSGSGVELWNPATNTLAATVRTPDRVHDVAFSPDGRTLAASCGDLTSIWAIVEPVGRTRLSGFGARPSALAFGPGETLALALWGEAPRLWTSGQCPSSAHVLASERASLVAFDNQGRLAAIGSDGIDWLAPQSGLPEPRSHLAIAPDGPSESHRPLSVLPGLLAGLGNWSWDLPLSGFNHRGGPSGGRRPSYRTRSASSADGRVLAVSQGSDVYLWKADAPDDLVPLTDDPPPAGPRLGRRHRDQDDSLNSHRSSRSRRRGPTAWWTEVAVSSSGDRVYLASSDGGLAAWQVDGPSHHALGWADRLRDVSAIALSPDGRILAVGVGTGSVLLLNPSDGRQLALVPPESPESGPPTSLSISPDGHTLAIGDRQGRIALWKLPSSLLYDKPSLLVHLPGHLGSVSLLAFNQDSRQLASADDKIVQVWELDQVHRQLEKLGLGW